MNSVIGIISQYSYKKRTGRTNEAEKKKKKKKAKGQKDIPFPFHLSNKNIIIIACLN